MLPHLGDALEGGLTIFALELKLHTVSFIPEHIKLSKINSI